MRALLEIVLLVLNWYSYLIIAMAILSWLVAFDVINFRNDIVRSIWRFLEAVTEPALRPIRRVLPNLGGIDVSPVILLLIILFVQKLIVEYAYPAVY
ncbi:YggT family protein [Lichenibacterium dinghuense]|uniref:YggT family protein n=1 Tax=Lichenibacterium dinghuense TaxID=2895977 RepID=UPI001F2BF211|nr:YggT family protein [Lichenibacterium sp. 6Y81]